MLELIFQGFLEWAYGLALECWQYFSTALLDIMSMDFAYLKSHAPVVDEIMQILLAVGWALLIGNLVFQALKSMAVGLGFEGEDPKLLFARTFVFAFLLLASPQICEIGLSMTSKIIELLQIPDAVMRCAMKGIPIWHRMSFSSAAMKNRMMRFWVQQSSTTMLWKSTTVSSLPFSTKRSMAMSFYSRLMPRLPRRISGRKLIEGNCKKLQQLPIFL